MVSDFKCINTMVKVECVLYQDVNLKKKKKSGYLKPKGFSFFFNYAKLNYDDYAEKNKRMNKACILAGVQCSCAKISARKDHTSKF